MRAAGGQETDSDKEEYGDADNRKHPGKHVHELARLILRRRRRLMARALSDPRGGLERNQLGQSASPLMRGVTQTPLLHTHGSDTIQAPSPQSRLECSNLLRMR